MSKILVTGGNGFLGSHLINELLSSGHIVYITLRKNSDLTRINSIKKKLHLIYIDEVPLSAKLPSLDFIIHTATSYGRLGENNFDVIKCNLLLPLELLDIAVKQGSTKFINIDTVLPRDLNTYSLSKKQFLDWGKQLSTKGLVYFTNLKVEHFYGPSDKPPKFIAMVIKSCIDGQESLPLTNGEQMRDFLYIDDLVSSILMVMEHINKQTSPFSDFTIGMGQPIKIRDLVTLIKDLTGSKIKLEFGKLPYREHEPMVSNSDFSKIKELGWQAKIPLKEGIEHCIKSYFTKNKS